MNDMNNMDLELDLDDLDDDVFGSDDLIDGTGTELGEELGEELGNGLEDDFGDDLGDELDGGLDEVDIDLEDDDDWDNDEDLDSDDDRDDDDLDDDDNLDDDDDLDDNDDSEDDDDIDIDDLDEFDLEDDQDGDDPDDDFVLEAYEEPILGPHQGALGGAINYENFDPEQTDMDDVIGDVEEDMSNWHEQEGNTCAVVAQEFVLEALTGQEFDMDELRELAEENGWYDDGTPMWDVGNLCEHYGLQVDKFTGGTINDIEDCLNNGGKVIVSVDSDEVWNGGNDELFFPGTDADHALQVIGFDYSDPDNPMVILNDSGVANGCGAMISMENFEDAWNDSGCFMVTVYE